MRFELAWDVKTRIKELVDKLQLKHVDTKRIICIRSYGSKSKANARVWGLPKIWQKALGIKPYYIIEVVHERFDRMSKEQQTKTLIHELLHIPKTFSGGLRPHRYFHHKIDSSIVERLMKKLNSDNR